MIWNYLITAFRNLARHKLYGFINIAGLTVGLACAIFIILFVRDELSYDKWIPATENLYRVEVTWFSPGEKPFVWSVVPYPVPDTMLAQLPEVKAALHLENTQMTVATADRRFLDHVEIVSPNFFQLIRLPLAAGDRAALLAHPESAVITESAAKKYFGSKPALGQMLTVGGQCERGDQDITGCVIRTATVMVTGVLRDLPHNTQFIGDVFIPNNSTADPLSQKGKEAWFSSNTFGYVELAPNTDPRAVMAKLPAMIDRNFDPEKEAGVAMRGDQAMQLNLTPFRDVHLSNRGSLTPSGSWTTVYGFAAVGLLILLIAGFNFTNLATARAMVRAREISLRKVVGARRSQLMVQFLSESVLTALLSLLLAVTLVEIMLPVYDRMLGKPIRLDLLGEWPLELLLVGVAVLVGLLAGVYPALVLSRFRPGAMLRTNARGQSGSGMLRSLLVVMQFAVSIGLGIAALVVFAQISYARNVDLGLNKDGIVVMVATSMAPSTLLSFVHALNADPALKGAAVSNGVAFSGGANESIIELPGKPGTSMIRSLDAGPNFFSVYGIHILSGRTLSESHGHDEWPPDAAEVNIMINRAAAQRFGFTPESAVGKIIYSDNPTGIVKKVALTIVGVTADFNFDGDRREIAPTIYSYDSRDPVISVRVPPADVQHGLSIIDATWHRFAPSIAINRFFLDETFERQFLADEQTGRIFGIFVGIAIFIACLGLFGLAAFSTERRTKEIGLRKTFGARTTDIILLLLWQFSIPVLIANVIAWPVAYYYLHGWLETYAYRISLNPLYFVGAGVAALLIAWATVIVHAAHVARANPIHALRYE